MPSNAKWGLRPRTRLQPSPWGVAAALSRSRRSRSASATDPATTRSGGLRRNSQLLAAGTSQKRFDVGHMAHDESRGSGSCRKVGRPVPESAEENLGGNAQRHDRVEALVEAALVGNRADHAQ